MYPLTSGGVEYTTAGTTNTGGVEYTTGTTNTTLVTYTKMEPKVPPEPMRLSVPCGAWCFILGLAVNGAGCEFQEGHLGDHQLVVVSDKEPKATFTIRWKLEKNIQTMKEKETVNNDTLVEDMPVETVEVPEDSPVEESPSVPPTRQVPLGPVPTFWNLSVTQGSEGPVVIVEVLTPLGNSVYFLDSETANKLGVALIQIGTVPVPVSDGEGEQP